MPRKNRLRKKRLSAPIKMKDFFKGKKTYLSILLIVISLALQHFAKVEVTSAELEALLESGKDVVEIGRTDLLPTMLGLWASVMAIWARRRTDIEYAEDFIDGTVPKALDPKTGQPFKAGLFLILAAILVISFTGCGSNNLLDQAGDELQGASVGMVVGQANVVGAELVVGPYRPGIAFTFRYVQPVGSVPPPAENPVEIVYPTNEK